MTSSADRSPQLRTVASCRNVTVLCKGHIDVASQMIHSLVTMKMIECEAVQLASNSRKFPINLLSTFLNPEAGASRFLENIQTCTKLHGVTSQKTVDLVIRLI
jgi:hypothetical protein